MLKLTNSTMKTQSCRRTLKNKQALLLNRFLIKINCYPNPHPWQHLTFKNQVMKLSLYWVKEKHEMLQFCLSPLSTRRLFLAFSPIPRAPRGESQISPISHVLSLSSRPIPIFSAYSYMQSPQIQSETPYCYESFSAHPGITAGSTTQVFLLLPSSSSSISNQFPPPFSS